MRLFVDRARESNSAFTSENEDAPALMELCRRLDGIPLAIELAAARVGSMTPVEITGRLAQRFKLLTRGRRTVATRQQTLRNTIDWSYDLLHDSERRVLRRLSVFAGGFGLEAAESVVAGDDIDPLDVVDLLARVVEKSLVVAERQSGVTRYRLLETVRDYAWERLEEAGETDQAAQRHARHFVAAAEAAGDGLEGPDERMWRARIEADMENFRVALRWSIANGDVDSALGEIYALSNVYALNASPFGLLVLEAAELPQAVGHPLRAAALACAAMTLAIQSDVEAASVYVRETEAELASLGGSPDSAKFRCRVRGCLTTPVAYSGDADHLRALARAELEDGRQIGDKHEVLRALILLSSVLGEDEQAEAVRSGEEALLLAEELRVPSYEAWAPMMLAPRLASTDPARAETLLEHAREAAGLVENQWAIRMAEQSLAQVQAIQGNYRAAGKTMLSVADFSLSVGDDGATQSVVTILATLLAVLHDDEAALLVDGWAEAHGYDAQLGAQNVTMIPFGSPSYLALKNRQTTESLDEVTRQAHAMDSTKVVAFAAERLVDDLPDKSRGAQS
ncbi:MAG TPA: hypothetical protein VN886_07220 [Acidimicrobiales bacterium]|nr:hypothetical protein [Acidimicrobiales bacterium]